MRPYDVASDSGAFESSSPFAVQGYLRTINVAGITIFAGSASGISDTTGKYFVYGLTPGTYTVAPSSNQVVSFPKSQTVTIGPDMIGTASQFKKSVVRWTVLCAPVCPA